MPSGADLRLAYRLDMAEAVNVAAIARVVQELDNEVVVEALADGIAVYAGVGSPMTHALAIGLNGPVAEQEMERLEGFFQTRGSACVVDLCPLADVSVLAFLQRRAYRVAEFNNLMVRSIAMEDRFEHDPQAWEIGESDTGGWANVVCRGFSEYMPVSDEAVRMMRAGCAASRCWASGSDGQMDAAAAMGIQNGVALFYGDATLPEARRRGRQLGLIGARLAAARESGCDIAMASVLPGSVSHRNYERSGFGLLYMRVNLISAPPE